MGQQDDNVVGMDDNCHSTVLTPPRSEDYLMIPQSILSNSVEVQPTYYCGNAFPQNQRITGNISEKF